MMRYAITWNQCCFDAVVCRHDYANITVVNYKHVRDLKRLHLVLQLLLLPLRRSETAASGG